MSCAGLCTTGFAVYIAFIIIKKKWDARAAVQAARSDLVSKINKGGTQTTMGKPVSEKEKRNKLALAQTQEFHYEKTLKPKYMKEIKQSFRSSLQDHGVWFAPAFNSDDITALLASVGDDELILLTTQLCVALGTIAPTVPYKPSQDEAPIVPAVHARVLLKRIALRASKLSQTSAAGN
jgi:hypothetical protein